MTKALIVTTTFELFYLFLSFSLAEIFGQWSVEGEIIRTCVRIISLIVLYFYYRRYFCKRDNPLKHKNIFTPPFIASIVLFFLFAIVYSNATNESLMWQYVFTTSGLIAGFREELFYRGIVQNSLQAKYHYRTALVISCLVFTFSHLQYIYYQQTFAIMLISLAGIIFGSIFICTGSVFIVGAIHAVYDALLSIKLSPFKLTNETSIFVLLLITLLFLIMMSKKSRSIQRNTDADSDSQNTLTMQ